MPTAPTINLAGLFPNAQPGLLDVLKQLQNAQNSANKANEQRYQDVLGSFDGAGTAGMAQIGRQEEQALGKNTQDVTSRGLANTTVGATQARGIAQGAEDQRQNLQGQIAEKKAGVMERRTDQGPDMSMYANLLQGASQQQGNSFMANWHPGMPGYESRVMVGKRTGQLPQDYAG